MNELRYILCLILMLMGGLAMAQDHNHTARRLEIGGDSHPTILPAPTRTVLVMGDSLSAAHGIAAEQGWVALLAQRMKETFPDWKVVNASISGETTAGGVSRIHDELARYHPSVVIIELGANDGLRGLPLQDMERNLTDMILQAGSTFSAHVLLLGMQMPPNLGADYTIHFAQIYPQLAEEFDAALLPFLLEPIAMNRAAFQEDHLHPTAEVQPRLLEHVWPALHPLLSCPIDTPTRQCSLP